MHVICYSAIESFTKRYPRYKNALTTWYEKVEKTNYSHFSELRATFPSADKVGACTVFNIHGNDVRLIAIIHYQRHKLYIRKILTHAEYDKGKRQNECLCKQS
jgi:mRNA interferase HigB